MKKLFLLIASLAVLTAFVPNVRNNENGRNSGRGFNYHAVVRNSEGVLLADTLLELRVSLYPEQYANDPTWVETHSVRTDFTGSFGIRVGRGVRDNSSIVESYSDVDFEAAYYWIKIELREGNNYHVVSDTELPVSIYSEVAHNAVCFPAGMIVPFAGDVDNIPTGWMLCDGRELSRSAYNKLFTAIGVCWGVGNGSTTFNIPDTQGMFLRGVSGDSGNDPDAEERTVLNDYGGNTANRVGSYQGDAIRNITGEIHGTICDDGPLASGSEGSGALSAYPRTGNNGADGHNSAGAYNFDFDAQRVVPVGGDNRPKNVYVNYIIKL